MHDLICLNSYNLLSIVICFHVLIFADNDEGASLARHILFAYPSEDLQNLINIPDKTMKYTPLHHAAYKARWKLVPIFMKYPGLNLTPRDIHGNTPLHLAVFGNSPIFAYKHLACYGFFNFTSKF